MKKISVIIPVYNQASIIINNVSKVISVLNNCGYPFELILINDGSTDGSYRVMSKLKNNNIRMITKENQGLGSVLKLGFSTSTGQILIILDLDLSYGIENIPDIINLADNWDCVVCSKYANANNYPTHRKVLSLLCYLFCKCFLNISVRDMGSGLVMLKSHLVRNESFLSKGFGIHCELFSTLHNKNAKILEIPIQYIHNPSSFRLFFHGMQTIKEIISTVLKHRKI